MRIAEILTRIVTKRFDKPLHNPRSVWTEKNTFLIFVVGDTGQIGVGEVWCEAMKPSVLSTFVREELAPLFLGADIEDVERLWHVAYDRTRVAAKPSLALSALGGVETALWDLLGKMHDRPLHRLLGSCRDRVSVYASGGLYGPDKTLEDLAREMSTQVDRGFRAVKMKVAGASLRHDVERVAAVRAAIGPDIRLMVDAVYMLDASSF